MKLRTILLFGLIALAASAPMLFSRHHGSGNENHSSPTNPLPAAPSAWAMPGAISEPPANDSPFQFAGARRPISGVANNEATVSPASPDATLSQPVYWAFNGPAEYLRFDIDQEWINTRWNQVSRVPGEDNLNGLRVPLVSGPRPQDVHGSLTYYFDARQQLQRITLRGWTGDGRALIDFVTRGLGMQEQASSGAGLYSAGTSGKLKGALRLDVPPQRREDAPTEQFMVLMELTNPGSSLSVSRQVQDILTAMERSGMTP